MRESLSTHPVPNSQLSCHARGATADFETKLLAKLRAAEASLTKTSPLAEWKAFGDAAAKAAEVLKHRNEFTDMAKEADTSLESASRRLRSERLQQAVAVFQKALASRKVEASMEQELQDAWADAPEELIDSSGELETKLLQLPTQLREHLSWSVCQEQGLLEERILLLRKLTSEVNIAPSLVLLPQALRR